MEMPPTPVSTTSSSQGTSALQDPAKKPKGTVYGQIRIEGMQYFTSIPEAPQLTYSQLLSARLSGFKEAGWLEMAADVSGGTFFSRGQSHFVVHEAFLASRGKDFKVFAGRKKKDWSEMDSRWQMGLWQPNFSIDALRPEAQSLAGVFADYNTEQTEILAFATPIYIPAMGPEIREEDGGLVSNSRWYRAPSRDYDFGNRVNTITYSLSVPDTLKLVNNGGAALMGRMGSKERGLWVVASAGYLPVNELLLKRKVEKQAASDEMIAVVAPTVTHHIIASVDVGYTVGNVKTSVSYMEDRPDEKRPDAHEVDWAIQKLEPIKAYSVATDFTLMNVFSRDLFFQLSYLKVNGAGIQDINANGQDSDFTLFNQRLKFTDAVSFRVEGQLMSIMRRPLVTRFKYLYDYDQQGSLLNTEFLFYPTQKWAFLMGADVLGVQDDSYQPSSFLNQYRANDRVYGGMTYVF
ncbi:hypothetical protein D3C87_123670 [compost metagenome]